MLKENSRYRLVLALFIGLSLLCSSAFAQPDRNRTDRGSSSRGDIRGDLRKEVPEKNGRNIYQSDNRVYRHHYRNGRWYRRGWFGWEFAVPTLRTGSRVEYLPPRHTTVIIENTPYYYDERMYYRQLPDGDYMVVSSSQSQ